MEELIKQAFLHVDVIGPHVHQGHYDLTGPDGEIILPQAWETLIQPDWTITMRMWPIPEPPDVLPPPPPSPPPPLRTLSLSDLPQKTKQRDKKERIVTKRSKPRSVASASLQPRQKLHRNDRAKRKSPPGGFFAWAAGGKSAPSSSSSGSSTWSSHTPSGSDLSSAPTYYIPTSPGSEDHDDAAFADTLTEDARSRHTSLSNNNPTEIAFETEEITSSIPPDSPQPVECDEHTARVELSSSLHEEPHSSSRDAAVDKANAQAHVSEDTVIGDPVSRAE